MKEPAHTRPEASATDFAPAAAELSAAWSAHSLSVPADVVERFALAWEAAGTAPGFDGYLSHEPALRRLSLLELVKLDLHYRWLRFGPPRRLADYVREYPELSTAPLPPDLVVEEYLLRRRAGEAVDVDEYLRLYPEHAWRLRRMLGDSGPATQATQVTEATGAARAPDATATATSPAPTPAAPSRGTLDDLDAGQQVGDFDLLLTLGRGAFARVFLARQRSMQRLVAVKVSRDHGTEPQTLAQLDHDYIVRVFDQRYLPSHRLRLLYMQYLPGGTLQGVLQRVRATPVAQRSGRLLLDAVDAVLAGNGELRPTESSVRAQIAAYTWPEAVAWLGRALALALDHAAAHDVLHRDVKPANILLTAEGVPKLADFNISFSSKVAGDSPVAYFGGSLAYMSPEQMEACHPDLPRTPGQLDTRSDIYALGVVLWELLTGHRPFDDERADGESLTSLARMLDRRRGGLPPAVDTLLPPDCPASLRRVLRTCLAVDPDERWSTGAELAQQLELCLDPHARELVDPPPGSRRAKAARWIVPLITAAVAGPNALAGVYNYLHNETLIISGLDEVTRATFITTAFLVNGTLWPIGTAALVYFSRYPLTTYLGLRKGRPFDSRTLARARQDALLHGDRSAAVSFTLWLVAGVAIPVTVELLGGNLGSRDYLHFILSLTLCGAMAAVYPFFLVNFVMMRCLFPVFLIRGQPNQGDVATMRAIRRRGMFYLPAAASIPLVGVLAASFLSPEDLQAFMLAVGFPALFSIGGFVAVYALYRTTEDDVRAIERVVAKHGG